MSRREIREQIFKMLFQMEFHSEEELEEQFQLVMEELEETDEVKRAYIYSSDGAPSFINGVLAKLV